MLRRVRWNRGCAENGQTKKVRREGGRRMPEEYGIAAGREVGKGVAGGGYGGRQKNIFYMQTMAFLVIFQ